MYENKRELCEKTILRNIVAVCHTAQQKVDGDCFFIYEVPYSAGTLTETCDDINSNGAFSQASG